MKIVSIPFRSIPKGSQAPQAVPLRAWRVTREEIAQREAQLVGDLSLALFGTVWLYVFTVAAELTDWCFGWVIAGAMLVLCGLTSTRAGLRILRDLHVRAEKEALERRAEELGPPCRTRTAIGETSCARGVVGGAGMMTSTRLAQTRFSASRLGSSSTLMTQAHGGTSAGEQCSDRCMLPSWPTGNTGPMRALAQGASPHHHTARSDR